MTYTIRPMAKEEYPLLSDFLYHAIYVPAGMAAPPRSILEQPELQVYIAGFGQKKDDLALVAEVEHRVVGAVWVRIMPDYGHIDDATPSFAISLLPAYRGMGLGTALMQGMLDVLRQSGYRQASLAVQKANYAVKLYQKAGFEIVDENDEEYIMLCRLG